MSIEENGHTNGENGEVASREDSTAEHSFDDLARGVATGTVPRRKALRMLAASLFGGVLVAAPAGMALAAPRDKRKPGGTGCPRAGQIRNEFGKCECGKNLNGQPLTTCNAGQPNEQCIDPATCSGGQTVNTTTCQCECASTTANPKIFCGGQCVSDPGCNASTQVVDGNCTDCECKDPDKEINTSGECVCDTTTTSALACTNSGGSVNANCGCDCPTDKRLTNQGQCECQNPNQIPDTTDITGQTCICATTALTLNCEATGGTVNANCGCDCPATKVLNNQGSCVCEANAATAACTGSGGTLDATCACECPGTKTLVNGACVCPTVSCTGGTVNASTCVCECPSGKTLSNGACVCDTTTTSATNCRNSGGTFSSTTCACTCGAERTVLSTTGECVCPDEKPKFCPATTNKPNGQCKGSLQNC